MGHFGGNDVVEIEYSYSGWNSVVRSLTIERTEAGYVANGKQVPTALVDALFASVTNLVPAEAMVSCIGHTDDYPKFDVTLQRDGLPIRLISASNCTDNAPWLVIQDSRLHVQADGSIGRAMFELLAAIFDEAWWRRGFGEVAFEVTEGPQAPKGVETAPPILPRLTASVAKSRLFAERFPGGQPEISRIWCVAEDNPLCSSLAFYARVTVKQGLRVGIHLATSADEVTSMIAPDAAMVDRIAQSKVGAALAELVAPGALIVEYDNGGDCAYRKLAAPTFAPEADIESLSCDYYFVRGDSKESRPPDLFYLPSLNVAWLRLGDAETTATYFRALGADEGVLSRLAEQRDRWFTDLDGKLTPVRVY